MGLLPSGISVRLPLNLNCVYTLTFYTSHAIKLAKAKKGVIVAKVIDPDHHEEVGLLLRNKEREENV